MLTQVILPLSNQCPMTSVSELLCDTAVSILHAHEIGTHVYVDFESVKSPSKSSSWNNPGSHH